LGGELGRRSEGKSNTETSDGKRLGQKSNVEDCPIYRNRTSTSGGGPLWKEGREGWGEPSKKGVMQSLDVLQKLGGKKKRSEKRE